LGKEVNREGGNEDHLISPGIEGMKEGMEK